MRFRPGVHTDMLAPGLVALAVALPCLLGAGYLLSRSIGFVTTAEAAQGRIVDITGDTPTLVVKYRTGRGQERTVKTAGSDLYKNFRVGDRVSVRYDADSPADARVNLFVDMWLLPLFLGVFGLAFGVPSVFMLKSAIGEKLAQRGGLDRRGQRIQADYAGVHLTLDARALAGRQNLGHVELSSENGQHRLVHDGRELDPMDRHTQLEYGVRYVLIARWTDPENGREYGFESEPLLDNPERFTRGRKVDVTIDPRNPSRYRMELSVAPVRPSKPPAVE